MSEKPKAFEFLADVASVTWLHDKSVSFRVVSAMEFPKPEYLKACEWMKESCLVTVNHPTGKAGDAVAVVQVKSTPKSRKGTATPSQRLRLVIEGTWDDANDIEGMDCASTKEEYYENRMEMYIMNARETRNRLKIKVS